MSVFWASLREETFPSPSLQLLKGMEVSQKWTGKADHTGKAGVVLLFPPPLPPFGQSLISIISDVPMLRHQIRHMAHRESARTSRGVKPQVAPVVAMSYLQMSPTGRALKDHPVFSWKAHKMSTGQMAEDVTADPDSCGVLS